MRSALLISRQFDKDDQRLSGIREALRAAGYDVKSLALGAMPAERRDGATIYLHHRAMSVLMVFSQLVIAGVIAGYFLTFLPVLMTVIFWALILNAVFFVSRWGAGYRQWVLDKLTKLLARFETSKRAPELVFCGDDDSRALSESLALRYGSRLIDNPAAL